MFKHVWEPVVVAALEIGTTNASLAFSFAYDFKRDPLSTYSFLCHSPGLSFKTPTCILLDKKKQCVAFGYDAENCYTELVNGEDQDDYYFFDRFTMSLHNNENVTRDMVLKDKTGKQCSAVDVFTLSIKYLVDCLLEQLDRKGTQIRDDEIMWVLTIPPAWTDSGKQLMRESAEKAGLHPKRLLFVTETEAAFTYCHYIPTARLHKSKNGIMIKDPGTKSMVVNLEDMTADMTVLQQTYNDQLKELFRETGDDCGRTSVEYRFCEMLEEIVGGNVIAELKRQYPSCWLDLLEQFTIKTETFMPSNTKVIRFKLPLSLQDICRDLKSVVKSSSYVNETNLVGDKLTLKADLIIKLFTPTIDSIITLMKNTLSNKSTNGVSNILMVGGISECPIIQEAVREAFPDNQIIIPQNAGQSVLNGAVLFGHRPDYIMSVKGGSLGDDDSDDDDEDDDDDDDDDGCIGK